jgi:2-dehydro-3-deoxyphosphogluconate aldolase/(4S)-4-hydroxy-2-oxoglutarate aldolase
MNVDPVLKQRLICVAVIHKLDQAVPLAEALLAGGLRVIEVTFRVADAAESIRQIRQRFPEMQVGAGTLLAADQVQRAVDSGAQFGVSPGLTESVLSAARQHHLPFFPGVATATEIARALELGCKHLKFFPAEAAGGAEMVRALAAPFAHTGVNFIPTGGITRETLPNYLAVPQVAAIGGSWMADRKLLTEKAWEKVTSLTAEALKVVMHARAHV